MSSARYRRVGHTSNIDESLFGTDSEKDRAIRSGSNSTFSSSSIKGRSKKNDMKLLMNNSVVVTSSELEKIKVTNFSTSRIIHIFNLVSIFFDVFK